MMAECQEVTGTDYYLQRLIIRELIVASIAISAIIYRLVLYGGIVSVPAIKIVILII